jgi:leukotriene-A4 hydrolase
MLRTGNSVKILQGAWQPSFCFIPRLKPTCRFLAAEENIVTPYKFGVYDLLVLPPSFPYGGMVSSPRTLGLLNNHLPVGKRVPVVLNTKYDLWPISAPYTYQPAALLTGDRTLVDVVVHELTHSWFGNGVT